MSGTWRSRAAGPHSALLVAFCLLLSAILAAGIAVPGDTPPHAASPEKRAAASEALREVDALLKQTGEITGLPVRRPVKSAIASKQEIQRYVEQRLKETTEPEKLRAQEVALKKFGLLPADFQLQSFLVKLLTEQAAAYYDPRRNEFFIADWTPLTLQRPAIIHELTHALQDQEVDLDKFLHQKDLNQDEQTARAAMVEGGGVLAMMEYLIASSGMKREAFTNLDQLVASATAAEIAKFPVFAAAPVYLRDSLLFPYTVGMAYVRRLQEKQGKAAYAKSLRSPPRSTAEVMYPDRADWSRIGSVRAPAASPLPTGFALTDEDVLGAFDVRVLLKEYAGESAADRLASAWRGFHYALYENAARTSAFLAHRSRWKDAAAAAAFADAYRALLVKRGDKSATVEVSADTVAVRQGL